MQTRASDVKRLIEALALKTKESLDFSGFGMMSFQLEDAGCRGISQRYLYENAWRSANEAIEDGREFIRPSLEKLDKIAQFLGYRGFLDFRKYHTSSLSPPLEGCIGVWDSFVRHNSGKPQILRSPVSIDLYSGSLRVRLKGPHRILEGEGKLKNGCLYTTLNASDKVIHMVFKLGKARNPNVLQGVFSGISTSGDPIAGREVWVKAAQENENRIFNLENKGDKAALPQEVYRYFNDFGQNYIHIKRPSSFELDDLI